MFVMRYQRRQQNLRRAISDGSGYCFDESAACGSCNKKIAIFLDLRKTQINTNTLEKNFKTLYLLIKTFKTIKENANERPRRLQFRQVSGEGGVDMWRLQQKNVII